MGDLPKKCGVALLSGTIAAAPVAANATLYCSPNQMCQEEAIDLQHVHQQERGKWDPPPQVTIAISSSTAASIGISVFSWQR